MLAAGGRHLQVPHCLWASPWAVSPCVCCISGLHPSVGWLGMLCTTSSWLEDPAASHWGMTCVMSSSALNERDVTFLGMNSLEMLCRSEIDGPKTGFFSRCWHPETRQVQISDGYTHHRQEMGWEMTYNHSH